MKTFISLLLTVIGHAAMAQCYVYDYCSQANFNYGANCHGFALRYLEKGYNLSSISCGTPSVTNRDIIFDCINKRGFTSYTSFSGYIENATSSDHTLILYRNTEGLVTHSAVKLGSNSYLSKWESNGPLVKHATYDVPYDYYHSGYTITYHKLKSQYYIPNDPAVSFWSSGISLSGCTSCSCRTSQGYFLVSASMAPANGPGGHSWTQATWFVSGGSIAYTGNNYIYVNKPGGGSVSVTANATFTYQQYCSKPYSKFQMFFFPSCSGGGFSYSLKKEEIAFELDRGLQTVNLVLPETLVDFILERNNDDPGIANQKNINVKIFDLQGNLHRNVNISANEPYVELLTPLKKGIFIIRVTVDGRNPISERIAIDY